MSLTQHDEVFIKIYSVDYLLKCRVLEISERNVTLLILSGKVDMFLCNDPTVLIYYERNIMQILPADVSVIDRSNGHITFSLPEREIEEERRIFERYPVSLVISVRRKFSNKRLDLVAKNVSLYGMAVISGYEFEENELIDLDLVTWKNMFYMSGKIIWKKAVGKLFEYGLQLTHYDIATKQSFEEYLDRQKDEYASLTSKAR